MRGGVLWEAGRTGGVSRAGVPPERPGVSIHCSPWWGITARTGQDSRPLRLSHTLIASHGPAGNCSVAAPTLVTRPPPPGGAERLRPRGDRRTPGAPVVDWFFRASRLCSLRQHGHDIRATLRRSAWPLLRDDRVCRHHPGRPPRLLPASSRARTQLYPMCLSVLGHPGAQTVLLLQREPLQAHPASCAGTPSFLLPWRVGSQSWIQPFLLQGPWVLWGLQAGQSKLLRVVEGTHFVPEELEVSNNFSNVHRQRIPDL